MSDNDKILIFITKFVVNLIITCLTSSFFMIIWNQIMPALCGFNTITFWQSFFLGVGIRLINGVGRMEE